MSKMSFSNKGKSRFSRFLSSKGFYVALAVCLVGASAATWLAVDKTITGIEKNNTQMLEMENGFQNFPQLEEAEKITPDIPKTPKIPEMYSPPSSSSSKDSSLSEDSDKRTEPTKSSGQQVVSPVLPKLAYALPVKGDIVTPFSNGELVKNMTLRDWRTHDGIDIAVNKGEEIFAAADGTVVDIKNDPLWGTTVTISHPDNRETVYCGLDSNLPVENGDTVMAKQVIGVLDGVPCEISDKPHLHYAMKEDGKWIDPLSVMAAED